MCYCINIQLSLLMPQHWMISWYDTRMKHSGRRYCLIQGFRRWFRNHQLSRANSSMVAVDLGIVIPSKSSQQLHKQLRNRHPPGPSTAASIQFLGAKSKLGYWAEFVGNQRGGRNHGGVTASPSRRVIEFFDSRTSTYIFRELCSAFPLVH